MVEEEDDDLPIDLDGAGAVGPIAEAKALSHSGDYLAARSVLEAMDLDVDANAAVTHLSVLYHLDELDVVQSALARMVEGVLASRAASDAYLCYLIDKAEQSCLPTKTIGDLINLVGAREELSGDLTLAFTAAQRRQSFRVSQAPRAARSTLISLGLNCLPWTLLNRWGLRGPQQFSADYNPFCQASHKMAGLTEALLNNFRSYIGPDEIALVKSAFGRELAMRRDRSVVWNHNKSSYWLNDDFKNLRTNLEAKIGNFRRTCIAENAVFLISNCPDDYPRHDFVFLKNLQEGLRIVTGKENNRIILIKQRGGRKPDQIAQIDPHTLYFYCPYPDGNYKWWNNSTANDEVGIGYEERFLGLLFNCLEIWGLLDGSPRQ